MIHLRHTEAITGRPSTKVRGSYFRSGASAKRHHGSILHHNKGPVMIPAGIKMQIALRYVVGPEQCLLIRRRLASMVRGQYPMVRIN